jgi:hypothetical protein
MHFQSGCADHFNTSRAFFHKLFGKNLRGRGDQREAERFDSRRDIRQRDIFRISSPSTLTISCGVRAGTNIPSQPSPSKPA